MAQGTAVMYIGIAPQCQKNAEFLQLQKEAFIQGHSSPDFATQNYEVDFTGRATKSDLSSIGLSIMGF